MEKIRDIIGIVENILEIELAIADYYEKCAGTWIEHAGFWQDVEDSEIKHADNISMLILMIIDKRNNFALKKSLKNNSLQKIGEMLKNKLEALELKKFTESEAISAAWDIKKSLIKQHYFESFISQNREAHDLIGEIIITSHATFIKIDQGRKRYSL